MYSKLGLENLVERLIVFYIIVNKKACQYLIDYLPIQELNSINLSKGLTIYPLDARAEYYHNSFFPYSVSQENNLDSHVGNILSTATLKRSILDFIQLFPKPMFKIKTLSCFVVFTRLRVTFSHLHEHKFRYGILDIVHLICSCCTNAVENTQHYL